MSNSSTKGSPSEINQGKLLRALADWHGKGYLEFSAHIGRSKGWLFSAFKDERIPVKYLVEICRTFNIPIDYFQGKYTLPLNLEDTSHAAEDPASYNKLQKQEHIIELQSKIIERDQKIIDLQTEVMRLRELIQDRT